MKLAGLSVILLLTITMVGCGDSKDTLDSDDVGFNYMHETWTNPGADDPVQIIVKTKEQQKADFALMRGLGATAVRLHGANQDWVQKTIGYAKADAPPLRVWLSYRPNMRDLTAWRDLLPKEHQNIKPSYPDSLPQEFFTDKDKKFMNHDGLKILEKLRGEYVAHFKEFVNGTKDSGEFVRGTASLLESGDCLVIANELPLDLGYQWDNIEYKCEVKLLEELLGIAKKVAPGVKLTFAAMPDGQDKITDNDWLALRQAGLHFVSLNCYWSTDASRGIPQDRCRQTLKEAVLTLKKASGLPVAVTECGAVAHPGAGEYGGDGSRVEFALPRPLNLTDLRLDAGVDNYRAGEDEQAKGIRSQLKEIRNVSLRGFFPFAWDETHDNVFGLVRTNVRPLTAKDGPEYVHGTTWKDYPHLDTAAYVPVGRPALNEVTKAFGKPRRTLVMIESATVCKVEKVEIEWPASKTNRCSSILRYTLKTGADTRGREVDPPPIGVAMWAMADGGFERFLCVDKPENYKVTIHWTSPSEGTAEFDLCTDKDSSTEPWKIGPWQKKYSDATNTITITCRTDELEQEEGIRIINIRADVGRANDGSEQPACVARVKNFGETPVKLFLLEPPTGAQYLREELESVKRRNPDLEIPYGLGIEMQYKGKRTWNSHAVQAYVWIPLVRPPGHGRYETISEVTINPGETQEFFIVVGGGRLFAVPERARVFITDPSMIRIEEKSMEYRQP